MSAPKPTRAQWLAADALARRRGHAPEDVHDAAEVIVRELMHEEDKPMTRAKQRKLVAVLPKRMPEQFLRQALNKVHNDKARAQVERRFHIRDGSSPAPKPRRRL